MLPILFGWDDPGISVTAAIQLGSIIAVIGYFRNDLKAIFKAISQAFLKTKWHHKKAQLGLALVTGTLPILIAGLAIKIFWPNFETSYLRSTTSIALTSLFMAILLAYSEINGSRKKSLNRRSQQSGVMIGFAQILALIPGVSRSGITLTTALLKEFFSNKSNWEFESLDKKENNQKDGKYLRPIAVNA